jgi:hypothetical protein
VIRSEWQFATTSEPVVPGYRLGSDRGNSNHGNTVFSKRVMAAIRSPLRVRTLETDTVAQTVRGAQVGSECRLTVRSRAHKIEPPARREDVGTEAGHEVSTFVFERYRWH